MKVNNRFMVRAALVLAAAGTIGAFGACKDDNPTNPPQPPPPPPPTLAAPTGLTATPMSQTRVDLAWTDNATSETGYKVERCSGAGCTTFAQIGANLAANAATYVDSVGLVASTQYTYRVSAFDATTSSAFATATATTLGVTTSPGFTMVGAGEISTCNSDAGPKATAALVDNILKADTSAIAFTVGNNLADMRAGTTFQDCFPRTGWDAFRGRTWYAIGTGDFGTDRGPDGVYGYLGDRTGPAHKGWFSFDKGNWHIVFLNTSDWEHGAATTFGVADGDPATPGTQEVNVPSEQADWLAADLEANTKPCIAVISWERRFYTTGEGNLGKQFNMVRMGSTMKQFGVDLLISAKDKLYARFAPADNRSGSADPAGYRQFIVGTGGRSFDNPGAGTPALREAQIVDSWGVLKLTMKDNSYDWEFVNATPGGPTDSGSATCH
jgi:acid phosphatase type 7